MVVISTFMLDTRYVGLGYIIIGYSLGFVRNTLNESFTKHKAMSKSVIKKGKR